MQRSATLALLLLFSFSAFAGELQIPRLAPAKPDCAASVPSFKKGIDLETKKLIELWVKERDGSRRRMACDFSCTDGCWHTWFYCRADNNPSEYCCAVWRSCMCINQCCPDEDCPTGCPG